MSASDATVRACPSCGAAAVPGARYCIHCGTRLADAAAETAACSGAVAASIPDQPPPAPLPPPAMPEWTASPADWQPGVPPRAARQERRWLWIALGIAGFLIFCCCTLVFVSIAVSPNGV